MADNNVHQLREEWNSRRGDNGGNGGHTGGGPPGGNELEKRVENLEKNVADIRERLSRVETKLEGIEKNMATKADIAAIGTILAEFKASIAEGTITQTRWIITFCVGLAGLAFTAAKLI